MNYENVKQYEKLLDQISEITKHKKGTNLLEHLRKIMKKMR